MSAALIRCLLAVYALSENFEIIVSKDVAQLLGVKRPTVHRSLQVLQERGMIQKELYGDVHLTEEGARWRRSWKRSATIWRCCLRVRSGFVLRKA